jgi:hypothetical protein
MKMAGTGATFPSMPGAQRVLETSLLTRKIHFKCSEIFLHIDNLLYADKIK